MPPRTPESYLFDMLEATRKIRRFTAGYDEERFKQDEKTVSAVERQFMIIGEAAKHIDPAFSDQFPEIDFRLAKAMRNFIVHHYDRVDSDRSLPICLTTKISANSSRGKFGVCWRARREELAQCYGQKTGDLGSNRSSYWEC
jgi:uncharacterized protein with HEPN domain